MEPVGRNSSGESVSCQGLEMRPMVDSRYLDEGGGW